jgi:hypothetical protein
MSATSDWKDINIKELWAQSKRAAGCGSGAKGQACSSYRVTETRRGLVDREEVEESELAAALPRAKGARCTVTISAYLQIPGRHPVLCTFQFLRFLPPSEPDLDSLENTADMALVTLSQPADENAEDGKQRRPG